MVVADSIFYEVFFVVTRGGKELVGVQGDGSKIVAFRVTGIGKGYFPGGAVGLFAVGHDTAAAKVQDHTEDIWLGLQVIHDQITAHAFSNGTKIQGTAIKKGYIVSVHLNFLVAHFGKKSVNFGLVRDMRILAESGNIFRRAKALVPILVPLFISAFRRADELATAMECRCYHGGEGRTALHVLRYERADWLVLGGFIVLAAGIIVLGRFGL